MRMLPRPAVDTCWVVCFAARQFHAKIMNTPQILSPSALLLGILLTAPIRMLGQDSVTIPKAEYQELKQQAERAKQLNEELERTRAELTRLKQTSRSTPPSTTPTVSSPTSKAPAVETGRSVSPPTEPSQSTAAPKKVVEPVELPPKEPGEVVDVTDVIQHFAQNAPAAAKRYKDQPVKLQGVIAAFDKPGFRRDFEIVFRTTAGQLVCRVGPPERFGAVFTTRSGAALTGRTERGAEVELLNVGDVAAIEGICQGMKDGSILVTRCKVAGLK